MVERVFLRLIGSISLSVIIYPRIHGSPPLTATINVFDYMINLLWQRGQWEISGIIRVFYLGFLLENALILDIGKVPERNFIYAIRG